MYEIIDIENWKRKDLFRHFIAYDNPTWDLICDIRITDFYIAQKEAGATFFLSFLYAASRVCNSIEELRCRIDSDGQVRLYDTVHPGSTILYENGTFGFGYFSLHADFHQFISDAKIE
jgi:chloramphenicol O-acetyltransferase type A